MSDKRKSEKEIYLKLRLKFLQKFEVCQICSVRFSGDIHHKKGTAGAYYLDTTTWMALCRPCHQYLENNKKWARSMGFLECKHV